MTGKLDERVPALSGLRAFGHPGQLGQPFRLASPSYSKGEAVEVRRTKWAFAESLLSLRDFVLAAVHRAVCTLEAVRSVLDEEVCSP